MAARRGKASSSGLNVFEDLGLPDAEDMLTKAELTRQIYGILKTRRLTQRAAARLLGIAQPDVSALMRGRYTGFSAERLFRLLTMLGRDVEIVVKRKARSRDVGRVSVIAA